jgi:hypothetical protein
MLDVFAIEAESGDDDVAGDDLVNEVDTADDVRGLVTSEVDTVVSAIAARYSSCIRCLAETRYWLASVSVGHSSNVSLISGRSRFGSVTLARTRYPPSRLRYTPG